MTQQVLCVGLLLLAALCITGRAQAKTWHVSERDLPGVPGQFQTISEAAEVVAPGDRVIIHSGTYREQVLIEASGEPDSPIQFQAAPGAHVVVTGADCIRNWQQVEGGDPIFGTDWPHRFVTWNAPHHTHPNDEFHRIIGRAEQVIINGYLLRQVLEREKLSPGTFFVDLDAQMLLVWAANQADLAQSRGMVETSTRERIWVSQGDHVQVKGLRFRYAANRAQLGAVQFAGDHNVIENCVFERTNASGAALTGEYMVVRNCLFQDNGQLGFGVSRAHHLRMTGCTVRNNNTKGYNRGWEAGGNKVVFTRGAVIEHSQFIENRGNGIWFDIGNEDNTVRHCLIAHNEDAGIFYEISYGLHAHDNVIVGNGFADTAGAWGANSGISLSSSPDCVIERNLIFGNKEGFSFREQPRSTPCIDDNMDRPVWNQHEVIRQNVIASNRDAQTWGWFDVNDERHWPATMQEETTDSAEALNLEQLALTLQANLYAAQPGQGLFHWGVPWKRNKKYASLSAVQQELGLEQDSEVAELLFADPINLDFRVPADSPALRYGCYPQGDVPGVQLGVLD